MNDTKKAPHTPGPWSFSTNPQPNGCPTIGARGLMVAVVTHSVNEANQRETALSNARLIAAAPELLEALRDAESFINNGIEYGYILMPDKDTPDSAHETPKIIRAAIAKATGERE